MHRLFQNDQLITIVLQDTGDRFHVQKALVCNASEYFTRALQPSFQEGQADVIHLQSCETDTFKLFLYWLCNRVLPPTAYEPQHPWTWTEESQKALQKQQMALTKLWIFAESRFIAALQNETMRRLLTQMGDCTPPVEAIRLVAQHCPDTSVLRAAVIQEAIVCLLGLSYEREQAVSLGAIPEFMDDFLEVLYQQYEECGIYGQPIPSNCVDKNDYERYMVPES